MQYVGIDIHKHHSAVAVVDGEGKLVGRAKLHHR